MRTDLFDIEECDDSAAMLHVVEHHTDRRGVLSGIGLIAASALRLQPVGALDTDAELIAHGRKLDAAWSEQAALEKAGADIDEAYERARALINQIELIPATTLAGVIVKARACSWCHSGEPFEPDFFADSPTTDSRIAASVLRDLLTISGRPVPQPAI